MRHVEIHHGKARHGDRCGESVSYGLYSLWTVIRAYPLGGRFPSPFPISLALPPVQAPNGVAGWPLIVENPPIVRALLGTETGRALSDWSVWTRVPSERVHVDRYAGR